MPLVIVLDTYRYCYIILSPRQAFVVCQEYQPPPGYVPTMVNPLLDHAYTDFNQLEGVNR